MREDEKYLDISMLESVLSEDVMRFAVQLLYNIEQQHKYSTVGYAVEIQRIMDFFFLMAKAHGATEDDIARGLGLKDWDDLQAQAQKFVDEAPEEMLEEAMEILERLDDVEQP